MFLVVSPNNMSGIEMDQILWGMVHSNEILHFGDFHAIAVIVFWLVQKWKITKLPYGPYDMVWYLNKSLPYIKYMIYFYNKTL